MSNFGSSHEATVLDSAVTEPSSGIGPTSHRTFNRSEATRGVFRVFDEDPIRPEFSLSYTTPSDSPRKTPSALQQGRIPPTIDNETENERKELLAERESFINRLLEDDLSPREQRRLEFVRWQLDRIDDLELKPQFAQLETIVQEYERFAEDVDYWVNTLAGVHRRR